MACSLADLDSMSLEQAQSLPFAERDRLLDLAIADGRKVSTGMESFRTGLYSDYFDEDLTRLLKLRAIRVMCRGHTPSGFDGVMVGDTDVEQYRAAFQHLQTTLDAAGTSFRRVVTMVIYLTSMDNWSHLNEVYREFVSDSPCRAVIGTTGLAQPPLAIEIVSAVAYRVAP